MIIPCTAPIKNVAENLTEIVLLDGISYSYYFIITIIIIIVFRVLLFDIAIYVIKKASEVQYKSFKL